MSAVTMESICGRSGVGNGDTLQQVQLPQPGRVGRRRAAVHPARRRAGGLQDRPEQLRAVGQHRLAAGRAVRLPAHDPRRSEPGDGPGRLFGGLRAPGPDRVHRSLRRQPRRHHLADPRRQHRPGAGRAVVAGAALADRAASTPRRSTRIRPIRSRSARTGPTASTRSRRTSRSRASATGRSASRARSRKDMAVEIRYVGNRGDNEWSAINYNCTRSSGCTSR